MVISFVFRAGDQQTPSIHLRTHRRFHLTRSIGAEAHTDCASRLCETFVSDDIDDTRRCPFSMHHGTTASDDLDFVNALYRNPRQTGAA